MLNVGQRVRVRSTDEEDVVTAITGKGADARYELKYIGLLPRSARPLHTNDPRATITDTQRFTEDELEALGLCLSDRVRILGQRGATGVVRRVENKGGERWYEIQLGLVARDLATAGAVFGQGLAVEWHPESELQWVGRKRP